MERDRDGGKEAERHAPTQAKSLKAVRAWGLVVRSERNPALLVVGKPGDQGKDQVPERVPQISGVRAQI